MKKNTSLLKAKTFEELLDVKYGKVGTKKRNEYEKKANYFVITEVLKSARKEAKITQQQLADKIGTQKSYISRIENGKCDIQLSTLFKIFETGLSRNVQVLIN